MKFLIFVACLPLTLAYAHAETLFNAYPSCNLAQQRSLTGEMGGSIKDPAQAHISMRANILEADIGNVRKARRITQDTANQLWKNVEQVRTDMNEHTHKTRHLSQAERRSYDRILDSIAMQICQE
ncbi:hypothetical protein F1645_02995 [Novacetimonas hansenii]|uniref:Uncharacterized protein n=1 Tax=Novacetimonas hansenii TaxID=436 RepID=A0AAW5ETI7_NOVHA|nr:hypothetical protein [Novacetimonas hansenii]MCJ8354630.1 hypothetical protein [Novacetimonas hansenii]GAN84588.1 hypothetical protein Gaha_0190_006 [Novacetimonas hansenii JCM 7643]GBQ58958.1 hypothetical protein AA0243_1934 [Novacetimonas hansenii NRIC 0243]GEC64709.1 hypothetical protein GHA01_25580 [Novacetimonas hansenii]